MKLSKFNNVVVKNSLYVLLFVVSYTALLRYYKTEFFVDTTIDKVFGWAGNHENPGLKNQTEESCRQLALKDPKYVAWGYRTNDHPDPEWKNTCFLYTQGFQPFNGNPSDVAHITGCLRPDEKVSLGCKVPEQKTSSATVESTQETNNTTICDTKACNSIINDYITKKWAYTSTDFGECKGCPVVSYPDTLPTTTNQQTNNDFEVEVHTGLLALVWLFFLVTLPEYSDQTTRKSFWTAILGAVGFPNGLYSEEGELLYNILNNTKHTFSSIDEKVLAPFTDRVKSVYTSHIVASGSFVPTDKNIYENSVRYLQILGPRMANISVDPSMYTNDYKEQVKMIIEGRNDTSSPQVEDKLTPVQVKPVISAPVFKPYEQNQTSTSTTSTEIPHTTEATQNAPTSTSAVSLASLFASFSSKFLLYVLLSIIVSIVLIVLVVWGVMNLTKVKTVPNSTF